MALSRLQGPEGDPWGLNTLDPPSVRNDDGTERTPSSPSPSVGEDVVGGNDADMGTMSETGMEGGIDAAYLSIDEGGLGRESEREHERQRKREWEDWGEPLTASPVQALRRQTGGSDSGGSSNTATMGTIAGQPGSSSSPTPVPHAPPSSASLSSPPLPLPVYPRLTRAFSMPLPAQLRHLQHPLIRSPSSSSGLPGPEPSSPTAASSDSSDSLLTPAAAQAIASEYFHSLSLELADSVQPIIQTLLQLSPPHILDPAKEQFSACMVNIPTASVSGLLNAMKGLNFLSARLASIGEELAEDIAGVKGEVQSVEEDEEEFDIGEMLQGVGDTLSGLAAQAGVDLVLFHGEAGMLHVGVKGDESAMSFILSHVLRQILSTAERGDTLELGLHISKSDLPRSPRLSTSSLSSIDYADPVHAHLHPRSPSPSPTSPYPTPVSALSNSETDLLPDDPSLLHITFTIQHRLHVPILPYTVPFPSDPHTPSPFPDRLTPNFAGSISSRLLSSLNATFSTLPPSSSDPDPSPTRSYALTLAVRAGAPLVEPPLLQPADALSRQPFSSYSLPREPTLLELAQFARVELRNKRVALYASPSSAFGRVVTSYLTSWGMDVVHVPTDGAEERDVGLFVDRGAGEDEQDHTSGQEGSGGLLSGEGTSTSGEETSHSQGQPPSHGRKSSSSSVHTPSSAARAEAAANVPPNPQPRLAFVIIDDDVLVLRRRLVQLRAERDSRDRDSPLVGPSSASGSATTERRHRSGSSAAFSGRGGQTFAQQSSPPTPEPRRPSIHHRPRSNTRPRSPEVGSPPKQTGLTAGGTTDGGGASSSGNDSTFQSGLSGASSTESGAGSSRSPIIIHFTSLANFKLVRDAVQSILALPPPHLLGQTYFSPYMHPALPNVLVVPKPAGPRRLLTALHTGLSKPLVDPFFAPIATSPLSPATGTHPLSPLFSPLGTAAGEMFSSFGSLGTATSLLSPAFGGPVMGAVTAPTPPSSSPQQPPANLNLNQNQHNHVTFSGAPPMGALILPSGAVKPRSPGPSPLAQPPQTVQEPETEYFPPTPPAPPVMIGSSASSGVILQSPDGRPTGVFFQPQTRSASNPGSGSGSGVGTGTGGGGSQSAGVQQSVQPAQPSLPHSQSTSSVGSGLRHMSRDDFPRPLSSHHQLQPHSPPSHRGLPSGTIFSPSAGQPFHPSMMYEPQQHATAARRGLQRMHTAGETRPFLLPFRGARDDAESGDASAAGEGVVLGGNRTRTARRTPSSGTTGSAPPAMGGHQQHQQHQQESPPQAPHMSRPGSSGQQPIMVTARPGSRRNSGQIVHGDNLSFGGPNRTGGSGSGGNSAGSDGTAGGQPSSTEEKKQKEADAQKEAARANIRKLIQAGGVSSPSTPLGPPPTEAAPAVVTPVAQPTIPSPASGSSTAGPTSTTPTKPVPPVARRSSIAAVTAAAKKKSGDSGIVPPINVLIVEDNPINQTILTTFMRKKKIKFGTAKDGAEAVEKWKTGGYHLILMDIQMPVMDGIEATKEIRRLESHANLSLYPTTPPSELLRATSPLAKPPMTPGSIPASSPHRSSVIIVALTASSLQSDRVAALAAGCNDFLTKPVSLTWLEKKIIEWGSIKALQMWADSAVTRTFSSGQAARGQKVRESLRIDRSGRNSPGPLTPASERPRSIPGPAPALAAKKDVVSAAPIDVTGDRRITVSDRRAASTVTAEAEDASYFPPTMTADVVGPAEARSILLQDVLEESSESDSPTETLKAVSPEVADSSN